MTPQELVEWAVRELMMEHPGMPQIGVGGPNGEQLSFAVSWEKRQDGSWRGYARSAEGWVVEAEIGPEGLTEDQQRHLRRMQGAL